MTSDTLERVGCRGHHDSFWSQLQDEQFDTLIFEIEQTCKFDLWSMNFDLRGQRSPRIIQYIFVNLFVQAEYIHHFSLGRYWFLMIFENLTFLVTVDTLERVGRRGHHDNFWSEL